MANEIYQFSPTGNMDKDSDPRNVGKGDGRQGDYIDSRNTQVVSDQGEDGGALTPTYGNEFAFSLGEVSAQNKRYRVTVDGDATKSHKLRFLSTDRSTNIVTGTGSLGEVVFNGTISSLQTAFSNSQQFVNWVAPASGNSIEFEMTTYQFYNWFLESAGTDDVQVECIQEAVSSDLSGPLKDIGKYDLLGDLFVFSTTQDNIPSDTGLEIAGIGPVSGGQFVGPITTITFTSDHNFQVGQLVRISGSNQSWQNGVFVITSIPNSTTIGIVTNTAFGQTYPTGISGPSVLVESNPIGIGEIGVVIKDNDSEAWAYTRLLRSVELNFVSKKAIRTDAREKGGSRIVYYTDKYNEPRRFVYSGDYSEDGALSFNNSLNGYSYGFIDQLSSLLNTEVGSFTRLVYEGQSDSGGGLTSGNKYYIYRFVDEDESVSNWSEPTRAIPVFPRSLTADTPVTIKGGSAESNPTTKVVNLSLNGIPQGIFSYVDFAVLESDPNGAISGTKFKRSPLSTIQTSVNVSHSGIEDDSVLLDVGELVVSISSFSSVRTVGDLTIIDRRLVMGDVSYQKVSDIQDWASQIKHQLAYKQINGLGVIYNEKIGGYLDPNNVYEYPSVVLYETYRVGIDVEFIDGSQSPTFWVDDIRIDTLSGNAANPTDNRRIPNGGLPDYALNVANASRDILVPHLIFSNINMDFLVDGVPIKNIISSFTFRFAEIKKEVLASGFLIMGISGNQTVSPVQADAGNGLIGMEIGPESGHHCQYLNWNSNYRQASLTSIPSDGWAFPDGTRHPYPDQYTAERKTAFFYSPEVSMGDLDGYEVQAADKLNVYYPVERYVFDRNLAWNGLYFNTNSNITQFGPSASQSNQMLPSEGCELAAYPPQVSLASANSNGVLQYDINDASILEAGQSDIISGVEIDTFHKERSNGISVVAYAYNEFEVSHGKCLAIRSNSDIFPYSSSFWTSNNVDYGVYYAQLFRESPNKYGDIETTEYQPYGQKYSVESIDNILSTVDVYGGDAFIVKTLLKNRFPKVDQPDNPPSGVSSIIPSILSVGRHVGMTYFAQSYRNMELVNPPDDPTVIASYPESFTGAFTTRFRDWLCKVDGEYTNFYNPKYSYGLSQIARDAYSERLNDSLKDVPTRLLYSSSDIYSATYDGMRTFLPLNIFDLDGTFGKVEAVENVGGELFTLQQRKFQIQAFNARGRLETTANSVDVLLKSGDVLSQDGKTLSFYGTEHKWSAILGRNQSGKDVIYWFNAENGVMMRFGADGTRVISARGMSAFFVNYTKWVRDKHEHAFEQGIRGVWDDRRKEAIWTFYGWRNVSQWVATQFPATQSLVGTVVRNDNAPSDTYENTPRFFRCIVAHANSAATEPSVGPDWEQYWEAVPYTDANYYSIFTIAFNELTNGFRCFYGHLPKTYLQWGNTFLSSHPVHRNLIFEHRKGLPTTWYGFLNGGKSIAPKVEDAYIEAVINPAPAEKKRYLNGLYVTDIAPYKVEYRTATQETFDTEAEFVQDENEWKAPIRNDITQTGDPTADGDHMYGGFLKVRYFFEGGKFSTLYNFLIKLYRKARLINR